MLKNVLKPEVFKHFMAVSIATSILVSSELAEKYLGFARQLLKYFVQQGVNLYGEEFLTYNTHSLLHLCDDVELHGNLDNISAFPFENYLQSLKKLVRSPLNPVAQIVKRLNEMPPTLPKQKEVNISCTKPNNAYILENDVCCIIERTISDRDEDGKRFFMCRVCTNPDPLIQKPWNSRTIGAFRVNWSRSQTRCLPEEDQNTRIFMAILHHF